MARLTPESQMQYGDRKLHGPEALNLILPTSADLGIQPQHSIEPPIDRSSLARRR